jgi:O-antigen ligase
MAILPSLIDPLKNDKKFWIKILVFSSVAPLMIANLDMVRGGVVFEDAGNRILGTFTHPNILGFYLVWLLVVVLYVFKSGLFRLTRTTVFLLVVYLANIFVLLVATKTRNAWICAWLLCFLYGVFKEKKYIAVAVGLLCAGFLFSSVSSRMTNIFEQHGKQENSFSWRVKVWKDSMDAIGERLPFGHGLGCFRALSGDFLTENRKGAEAHNVYVQLLFEMGLAGLVSYLAIYACLFREFYWRYKTSAGGLSREYAVMLAYLVIYLASGTGDNILYYLTLNWYGWFFLGVILKSARFQRLVYANP